MKIKLKQEKQDCDYHVKINHPPVLQHKHFIRINPWQQIEASLIHSSEYEQRLPKKNKNKQTNKRKKMLYFPKVGSKLRITQSLTPTPAIRSSMSTHELTHSTQLRRNKCMSKWNKSISAVRDSQ